jgi:hypothetical protein
LGASSFLKIKLPPYTVVGFDLTTHSSSLLDGKRRRYHWTTPPGKQLLSSFCKRRHRRRQRTFFFFKKKTASYLPVFVNLSGSRFDGKSVDKWRGESLLLLWTAGGPVLPQVPRND